jgi:HAD superfamily hydrolase (TIGR01549 family)
MFDSVEAILFDLDGTLLRVSIDFEQMKQQMLHLAEAYRVHDASLRDLDILAIVGESITRLKRAGRHDDARRLALEADDTLAATEIAASRLAAPMPGADRLLAELQRAGFRSAIVTRNSRPAAVTAMRRVGIPPLPVLSRQDVPYPKPNPDHLYRALARLESCPERAIMVGDHWMDIKAGRSAGASTAGVLTPGKPADWFSPAEPDCVLQRIDDLLSYLPVRPARGLNRAGTPDISACA